jgi:hypothetical protein
MERNPLQTLHHPKPLHTSIRSTPKMHTSTNRTRTQPTTHPNPTTHTTPKLVTDMKLLQPQLAQYSYIGSYAFSEPLSPREAENKLRFSTFGYSYILIVAVVGGFYGW